ncbi:MAG TPA: Ig-like domain-containing protein [Gemmatimonadales bacterium]|nr:Ig-like domain-containing protein [Gemmatimonadales bacterium]
MRGQLSWVLLGAAIACSGLTEGEGGVVGIEVRVPGPDTVEVGEAIQLSARPLDKNGDSAATAVTWISSDPTASIDPASGILTGVAVGTARVQATVGALGSELITFAVVAPADTLVLASDSVPAVPVGTEPLPDLITRLDSFNPAGPLASRGVIYTITSPDPAVPPAAVLLTGNVPADTLYTGTDGTATTHLVLVPGAIAPESVIVTVRAERTRGAPVTGSGQRFIVRFLP